MRSNIFTGPNCLQALLFEFRLEVALPEANESVKTTPRHLAEWNERIVPFSDSPHYPRTIQLAANGSELAPHKKNESTPRRGKLCVSSLGFLKLGGDVGRGLGLPGLAPAPEVKPSHSQEFAEYWVNFQAYNCS